MKNWNDFFSEETSKEHDDKVLFMAHQKLVELRGQQTQKKSLWDLMWVPGLGIGLAGVAAFIFLQRRQGLQSESMEGFAAIMDNEDALDELMDDELDLDLIAEIDEFEDLNDSGILDKELGNERS